MRWVRRHGPKSPQNRVEHLASAIEAQQVRKPSKSKAGNVQQTWRSMWPPYTGRAATAGLCDDLTAHDPTAMAANAKPHVQRTPRSSLMRKAVRHHTPPKRPWHLKSEGHPAGSLGVGIASCLLSSDGARGDAPMPLGCRLGAARAPLGHRSRFAPASRVAALRISMALADFVAAHSAVNGLSHMCLPDPGTLQPMSDKITTFAKTPHPCHCVL